MSSRLLLTAFLVAAAAVPATAAPWPRFATFGWLSPTPELTDSVRIADYARGGFNLLLPAWRDSGLIADTRRRLDLAQANGLVAIVWDRRLRQVDPDSSGTLAFMDSVVQDLSGHPAFLAYYLGDEPTDERITLLAKFFARLRARDPDHPGWNNLPGRGGFVSHEAFMAYTRRYVAAVRPTVLSNDHYDLAETTGLNELIENVHGLATVAREARLPFWGIILSTKHGPTREPNEGELRWQIGTWLSYGARGLGWFTYWIPTSDTSFKTALVDSNGVPTPRYPLAQRLNGEARAVGEILAGAAWKSTQYTGAAPPYGDPFVPDGALAAVLGRAAIGRFDGPLGGELLLLANSDSAQAQRITLMPARASSRVETFDPSSGWSAALRDGEGRAMLDFGPGGYRLVRIAPAPPAPPPGRLGLDLWPSPARGRVSLRAQGASAEARLSIRDVTGRLVRGLPAEATEWDGTRDDGGRAAPGVYFAQLESGGATATRRFLWLPR